MKKKYIQLGIVAVLLIGMLTALVVLQNSPEKEEPSSAAAERIFVIGGENPVAATQVDVDNESGSFTVINTKPDDTTAAPTIKGWEKLSLDSYSLKAVTSNASAMTAKMIVSEDADAEKLKEYGFDKPRSTVKIKYADNTGAVLEFGAAAPGGEGAYVRRGGENTIYLVMPTVADPFVKPGTSFVNKALTEADPEYKLFDKLILSGTDYPEPIVMARSPETTQEAGGMTFNTHRISSPVDAGLNANALEQLLTLFGLNATDVEAVGDDAATLEKYNLKEPAAVAAVTGVDAEHTFTLKISKPDEDKNVFVSKSGSPVIYKLPAESMPWLGLTSFDYMDKMAILPPIDTVSEVKVTTPEKTYVFKLTGEGDEFAVTLDGKELPEVIKSNGNKATGAENFKQFYQMLISASYSELADGAPPEGAKPILQIEYSYRGGKNPDVVSFYQGPTRKVFIVLNDGTPYFAQSTYVDRVIEDSLKISSGEAVKSLY